MILYTIPLNANLWLIPSLYSMYNWLIYYCYVLAYLEIYSNSWFADVCVQSYWCLLNLLVLELECGSYDIFTLCMLDSPDVFHFVVSGGSDLKVTYSVVGYLLSAIKITFHLKLINFKWCSYICLLLCRISFTIIY